MATFIALAKIFSTNFICNTKVARLGETLSNENFHIYGIIQELLVSYSCGEKAK